MTPPIYQTSTFKLDTCALGAEFALSVGPTEFYTRWGNPTTRHFETIIADLEGAEAALAFSSGMGAISAFVLSQVRQGDHILIGRSIYSGVHELVCNILARFGVESTSVDASDLDEVSRAFRHGSKLLLVESPTNPTLQICDLAALAGLCREHGVLSVVDNTFATPCNQNPIALGIDVVAHAATKAIGGHSDVTAGVICSRREVIDSAWPMLKIFGACLSPFEAWLLIRGLKTMSLRVARQSESAAAIAVYLEKHQRVEKVYYPGLAEHPGHELASRQMSGFGGMVSFEVTGGKAAGIRFAESLKLVDLAVSLGGAETILCHPASMTHAALDDDTLERSGLSPGLQRLSVGLEDPTDLIADLEQALEA
jgi:cystathionine beta-lyase/cystathionine gamma-synthase